MPRTTQVARSGLRSWRLQRRSVVSDFVSAEENEYGGAGQTLFALKYRALTGLQPLFSEKGGAKSVQEALFSEKGEAKSVHQALFSKDYEALSVYPSPFRRRTEQ